jgi:hypothetical protein
MHEAPLTSVHPTHIHFSAGDVATLVDARADAIRGGNSNNLHGALLQTRGAQPDDPLT